MLLVFVILTAYPHISPYLPFDTSSLNVFPLLEHTATSWRTSARSQQQELSSLCPHESQELDSPITLRQVDHDSHSLFVEYADLERIVDELVERRLRELLPLTSTLQRDVALRADGATVDCALTSPCHSWPLSLIYSSPLYAIDEDSRVGHCWSIPQRSGQLGIILAQPVIPSHVTIQHIPRNVAADISVAPRAMILWGVVDGAKNRERIQRMPNWPHHPLLKRRRGPPYRSSYIFAPLSVIEYSISDKAHTQTFAVYDHIQNARLDFAIVVLEILDNWGSDETCLYRVMIHGQVV